MLDTIQHIASSYIEELQHTITTLRSSVEEHTLQYQSLYHRFTDIESNNQYLINKCKALTNEINTLKQDHCILTHDIKSLRKNNSDLKELNKSLLETNDKLIEINFDLITNKPLK